MLYNEIDFTTADELLGKNVTEDIKEKAERWLYIFAERLGVQASEIKSSFIVDELIIAYAYREVCYKKSYGGGGTSWKNSRLVDGSGVDYFGEKLKYYKEKILELEKNITAAQLTGDSKQFKTYRSVSIERG